MFLRTPWLVPLLLAIIAALTFVILQRNSASPTSNSSQTSSTSSGYTASPASNPASSNPASSTTVSNRRQTNEDFLLIRGAFVVIGKSPDGDSVRFVPDNADLLKELKNSYRIRVSRDGSVQLRFEAIDAPELHFGSSEQPLGVEARDVLLKLMGFTRVAFTPNQTATAATPERVRGAILSQAAEGNGRPISYVLLEGGAGSQTDGSRVKLDNALLRKTMNDAMLRNGLAYYTVYSSTPLAQREYFKAVALEARNKKLGVWAVDKTAAFTLETQSDVDVSGQLILPKLFRRATSYLQDVAKGKFSGNLKAWLIASRDTKVPEDDLVDVAGVRQNLSDLITISGKTVRFAGDPLEMVFVEK